MRNIRQAVAGTLLSLGLFVTATSVSATSRDSGADATVAALTAMDARVFRIGTPIARAARGWCAPATSSGLLVAHATQYEGAYRAAAAARLGSPTAAVVTEALSPAREAGVGPGARIVAIAGKVPPPAVPGGFARSTALADALEAAAADGRLTLTIADADGERTVTIPAVPACAARFDVRPDAGIGANANGRYVQLTSATVEAVDDTGLAALIAHELAHNMLGHPALLDQIGGGLLPGFGRAGATIRATETQADRLSLYMLARSGYDVAAVVDFWRGFARRHDAGVLSDRTHPSWRVRVAALETEAARIAGGASEPPAELLQPVERNQRSAPSSPTAVSRPEA